MHSSSSQQQHTAAQDIARRVRARTGDGAEEADQPVVTENWVAEGLRARMMGSAATARFR